MADTVEQLRTKARELEGSQHAYGDAELYRKAADETEKLLAFAKEVIRGSWEGNLDGGDIQEMAEKHGLLKPEIYDLDKHGDHEDAVPGEDTIYVFPDWMKD